VESNKIILFLVLVLGLNSFCYSKDQSQEKQAQLIKKECFVSSNLQRVFIRAIEDGQELDSLYGQFLEKANNAKNDLLRSHLVETHALLNSDEKVREEKHVVDLYSNCIKTATVSDEIVLEQRCLRMTDIQFEAHFRKVKGVTHAEYVSFIEAKFSALPKQNALPGMLQLYRNLSKEIYENKGSIYDYAFETHQSCVSHGRNRKEA